MKKTIAIGLCLTTTLAACATNPNNIPATSVSPVQYNDYDCKQLAGELDRVSRKTNDLYASLKQTSANDTAQMAIGMVLFWPALFFLEGGDGPQATEYARLKGEWDAIEKVCIEKKCSNPMPSRPFVPPKEEKKTDDAQQQEGPFTIGNQG